MANYPVLITALREISGGTGNFQPHVQAEAEQLDDIFLNRKFLMHLHMYWDITEQLSFQSKDLQYSPGLIYDKYEKLVKLNRDIAAMRDGPGRRLKTFLSQLACGDGLTQMTMGCTESQVYESNTVIWRGVTLAPKDALDGVMVREKEGNKMVSRLLRLSRLEDVRNEMLEALREKMIEYSYDLEELKGFSILQPSNFPTQSEQELRSYGLDKLAQFLTNMGQHQTSFDDFEVEWKILLFQLSRPEYFDNFVEDTKLDAVKFWYKYLNLNDGAFNFPPRIKKLIRATLTISASTADAERSFRELPFMTSALRSRMEFHPRRNVRLTLTISSNELGSRLPLKPSFGPGGLRTCNVFFQKTAGLL